MGHRFKVHNRVGDPNPPFGNIQRLELTQTHAQDEQISDSYRQDLGKTTCGAIEKRLLHCSLFTMAATTNKSVLLTVNVNMIGRS